MKTSPFHVQLVEPEELFETTNSALQKVAKFQKSLASIDRKTFYSNLHKVTNIVCKHFGIPTESRRRGSEIH